MNSDSRRFVFAEASEEGTDKTDESRVSSVLSVGSGRIPLEGGVSAETCIAESVAVDASCESSGGYRNVRMNALKHGILSREAVLDHEDRAEFDCLLAELMQEHQPRGATENHLVEALASVMWRQRRVLQAERSAIHRSLKAAMGDAERVSRTAAPFEGPVSMATPELRDVMTMSPAEANQCHREAAEDLQATVTAMRHLWKTGPRAYARALRALTPGSREQWLDEVSGGRHAATDEELRRYIHDFLYPFCMRQERETRLYDAIKAQVLGEGVRAEGLELLGRYETHLDRKFERTLAMLVKLKEMRSV